MKKRVEEYSNFKINLKLFLDELKEIEVIFKNHFTHYSIVHNNYEYDDLDELLKNNSGVDKIDFI